MFGSAGGQQRFENLLGGHADLFGDGDGGEVVGVDFVLAKFKGDAEGFKKARAVGLHSVGAPGLERCDAAGVQTQHPVGNGSGQLALVRGDDDGAVALAEAGQQLDHLAGGFDIHVGEGLVEQKQFGDGEQNAGQRGALAHALRILAERAVEVGVEADLAQRFGWIEAGAAGIEAGEVAQILLAGELVVEHGCVAHVADAGARFVRLMVAEDRDFAVGGPQQAGENAQQGGFAGAVFADEDVAACPVRGRRRLGAERQRIRRAWRPGRAGRKGWNWMASVSLRSCFQFRWQSGWRRAGRERPVADWARRGARVAVAALRRAAEPGWAGAYLLAHLACSTVAWKTPSRPIGAFSQSLGIVLEGVRRRLGAFVDHLEQAAGGGLGRVALELIQHKGDVGAVCSIEPGCTKPSTRNWL